MTSDEQARARSHGNGKILRSGWQELGVAPLRAAAEQGMINPGTEDATEERACPVDTVIGEMMSGNGGAESERGIHGSAGKWSAGEVAGENGEAGGESRWSAEAAEALRRSGVGVLAGNGGGENEYQNEGEEKFEKNSLRARDIRAEIGSAERDGAPDWAGDERGERPRGEDCGEELHNAVKNGRDGADGSRDPGAEGDGGIEVSAGDCVQGGDEDGEGEAAGESDAERAKRGLGDGAEGGVSTNGACGEQDEKEGADEFGAEPLPDAVHKSSVERVDFSRRQGGKEAGRQRNQGGKEAKKQRSRE